MKVVFSFSLLLLSVIASGQNRVVDPNDPVGDVDIIYTSDDVARVMVVLNTVEAGSIPNSISINELSVNVQGQISWSTSPQDQKKLLLQKRNLDFAGSDRPFVMFADLYDGSNNLLKKTSSSNDWNKLSIRIHYSMPGKSGKTPVLNLAPPIVRTAVERKIVTIDQTGYRKDMKHVTITLRTNQKGTPFEVTQVKITKKSGSTETSTDLSANDLGDGRFCFNGELVLNVITAFDIDIINAKYVVSCSVIGVEAGKPTYQTTPTEVTFVPNHNLRIKNLEQSQSIIIPPGADDTSWEVETDGNGQLGVKFLNSEYAKRFNSVKPELVSEGKWKIKLDGLSSIPSETASTLYYLNGSKEISPPLIISKKLPRVSDFKFNGVKGDSLIILSFRLPGIDKETDPTISISGDKGEIKLGGKVVVKRRVVLQEKDKDMFDVTLDRNLTGLISSEAITKDLTFTISYGANRLYDFTATVFNQKLFDSKKEDLQKEANKKPKDRDKTKIASLVKDLAEMGKAIGNSIDDKEVADSIDGLQKAKGVEVKKVFSDIGKWALIVGKVVLPLLL